ncbi:AlbA family DNA-binding domain-containing protein [Arcanobacterium phocae]|uniref:AlbA family DNA-binding domain-containing protein n=1 Tax=Arcanobacterium phocae TaxID=131112 RepID=UPI001E4CF1C5|nr:ATP-binding protein [Arcanobacterium phocae]
MLETELWKIKDYCEKKEGQYFDRKSARIKPKDILRHLVAFANAEGGKLVIGIEDDGKSLASISKEHIKLMTIRISL